jgi:Fe-S cluster assembly protein SufD
MSTRPREAMTMTSITPIRTQAERAIAEAMSQFAASRPEHAARTEAVAAFGRSGLPHRRVEAYRYTDLRALIRAVPPMAAVASAATLAPALLPEITRRRLVFVDGQFRADQSDAHGIAGVSIEPLADHLARPEALIGALAPADDALVDLNTAFLGAGIVIRVAANAVVEPVIELVHQISAADPVSTALRHLVLVEAGASVALMETYRSPAGLACHTNSAVELHIADGATATLVKVQAEGDAAFHFSTLMTRLGTRAELNHFVLAQGASVARHQVFASIAGDHAKLATRGVNLLRRRQHLDTTLVVDHAEPHGESRELYKTILDDAARGVFQGKIIVQPKAQKTDGRMASHAVLLSDEAEIANKPELEIFADDVQCGHGATAGALDDRLKFYLMARGIPEVEAERLLVLAFLADAVEEMADDRFHDSLTAAIETWLAARG